MLQQFTHVIVQDPMRANGGIRAETAPFRLSRVMNKLTARGQPTARQLSVAKSLGGSLDRLVTQNGEHRKWR
jgi:hypothetical protein